MSNLIEILHRVSNKLAEITEEVQIYQIMNEAIKEILPDVYFIITKLQTDDMNFRITHSFGFDKYINTLKTLLGKDPFNMDFPFSDFSELKKKEFENRKLHYFPDGVYEVVNGRFNKTICRTIEKFLGISKVYAISFVIEQNYFGGAILFVPKSKDGSDDLSQDKVLAIETIAAQVSLVINKLRDIEALKKKDAELLISQSKFNQLVNQLNDVVWKANGDGKNLIDLNNSFEKTFGYSSSEFEKNPNLRFAIIHLEDRGVVKNSDVELIDKGETECEYRMQKPDGSLIWINERKSIVYDANGKAIQIGGVASDITEKKLLEEQLLLKNYALDNSPNAIGMADLNGDTIYVNNAFVELWGYESKQELIGKHFSEFSTNGNSPQESFDANMEGEVYIGEDEYTRKDGSVFSFIISAKMVMHMQKPLGLMAVFTDITNRKRQENIQRANEMSLLRLNNEKDKFFSIISHDLKSPFSGMLGLLDIMLNNYYDYSDEERLNIIQSSHTSAAKAYTLLTDLLEWARLQNNKIEIKKEAINPREILHKTIAIFNDDARSKEITIVNKIVEDMVVTIDVNSLTTVIRNLLINAIKFTSNGGMVELDIKQMHNNIEVSVKDTGVGMNEETISKLFRLDQHITMPGTNNELGTGLGLTICNDIVELNGWEMNIESQLGKGSTFRILIPR